MPFFRKFFVFLLDTVETFLVAAAVFVVCYVFLFRPFQVSGLSMYPTFDDQEGVLTNIIALRLDPIKRGDVIVFTAPVDKEKDFIKRVIGLPGEAVMVKDGHVFIDGNKLDEGKYLKSDVRTYGGSFLREGTPFKIPQGNYIVMGDNRSYSSDSREWGVVKKEAVIGKSWIVYWPPKKIGIISNPLN